MNKDESFLNFKTDKKTVLKNAFNSVVIQILFRLKGIITMPIMTYYLLPRELGIFNLIGVTVHLLTPLFSMNLISGPAIFMIQEKSKERIRDMFYTAFNSAIIFFSIFLGTFIIIMRGWGGKYDQYLILLCPMLGSNLVYQLYSSLLVNYQKTSFLVKITFFKDASTVLITIFLVMAKFSFYGMAFAVFLTDILASAYIYMSLKNELPFQLKIRKDILKEFLIISLPLLPVYIFNWIIQSSSSYFMVHMKGEDAVGKYSVIFGLSNVILIFTYALNLFWIPLSAKLWIENKEKYKKAFAYVFAAFSMMLLMAVIIFEFNSKLILRILVQNAAYRDAYVIMGTVAFALAMNVLITLLSAPLYSDKKPKLIFMAYFLGSVLHLILNFGLIPKYGLWGAALSTALSYFLIVLMMSRSLYRSLRFHFLDWRLLYVTIGFGALWWGSSLLRERFGSFQLIAANIVFLLSTGFFFYVYMLKNEEKNYIMTLCHELILKKERRPSP